MHIQAQMNQMLTLRQKRAAQLSRVAICFDWHLLPHSDLQAVVYSYFIEFKNEA